MPLWYKQIMVFFIKKN